MAETAPALTPLTRRLRRQTKRARRYFVACSVRAMIALCGLLPFAITRRLFPPLLGFFAHRMLRADIYRHLDLAYDHSLAAAEKKRIARRVAHNLGLLVAEVLALLRNRLPAGYIDDTEFKALDLKGGFLGLSAHIGNWEVLAWQARKQWPNVDTAVVAHRHANRHINRLIERMRRAFGVSTIYQEASPRRTIRMLTQGKIVAVAPDQDVAHIAGMFVPFFGKPAWTPTGPAFLACMAKAPLLLCFTRRTANGLRLVCPAPLYPNPDAPREEEIKRLTKAWSDAVEQHIREQPSDWMWFHKRWQTTPERLERRRVRRKCSQEKVDTLRPLAQPAGNQPTENRA